MQKLSGTYMMNLGIGLLLMLCSGWALGSTPSVEQDRKATHERSSTVVRDQSALSGTPVTTIRRWKIKKGGFARFLHASRTGVWPYFEKIGARVIGMWQVLNVEPADRQGGMDNSGYTLHADNGRDYDEVILVTRYASLDHWQATRNAQKLGGDGADYDALVAALEVRRGLTLETELTFLSGFDGPNGPFYVTPD